jgi:hypothetical protein
MDITKVDQDVAYVAMVAHVYCKGLLPMFHLCVSGRTLQVCLSRCCICFTHMLHAFYLDVAYSCNDFKCFQVFRKHVSSVSSAFRLMLQLLYLDILKVD